MQVPFTKMHGLGNDFVLLDERERSYGLTATQLRYIGDRHFGVGCDQILSLVPPNNPKASARYRIFNADGTAAEHCGNGVRCVARYLVDKDRLERNTVKVEIDDAIYALQLQNDERVRVDMGVPQFSPERIPISASEEAVTYSISIDGRDYTLGCASMGNPHATLRVDDVEAAPVLSLGPAVQDHEFFPARVNLGFMQLCNRERIKLRVFERGVGETWACGTGACAAVAIARRWGEVDTFVTVELRGGELLIEWSGEDQASLFMTGPATRVFQGIIEL